MVLYNVCLGIFIIMFCLVIWFAMGRIIQERFALLRSNYLMSIPLGFVSYFLLMWSVSLPFIFLSSNSLPLFVALLVANILIVVYIFLNHKIVFHKYINFRVLLGALGIALLFIIIYYFLWSLQLDYQNEDFIGLINNNTNSNNLLISFNNSIVSKFNAYYLWIAMLVRIFNFDIAFLTNWVLNILFLITFIFCALASISLIFKINSAISGIVVIVLFLVWHFILTIFPWTGTFLCFNLIFLSLAFYIRYLLSDYRNRYYLVLGSLISTLALNFSSQIIYLNFVIFFIVIALIIFKFKNNFTLDFMVTFFTPCISLAFLFFNINKLIGWSVLIFYFSFMSYVFFIYYLRNKTIKKLEMSIYEDRYFTVLIVPVMLVIFSLYLWILDRKNLVNFWNVDYFFNFKIHFINWIFFTAAWSLEFIIGIYIFFKMLQKSWNFNKLNILILWLFVSVLIILNPLLQVVSKNYFSANFNYEIMLWIIIIPISFLFIYLFSYIKKFNLLVTIFASSVTLSSIVIVNFPKINYTNYDKFSLVNKGVKDITNKMDQYMIDHHLFSIKYLGDYSWINVYFKKGTLIKNSESQFINNVWVNPLNVDSFINAVDHSGANWVIKLRTNIYDGFLKNFHYQVIISNDFYYIFQI